MRDIKVPGVNEWGKKRVDFYVNAASRAREDGILNEEEQELLQLEEDDAVQRQHKLDSINSVLDYKKLGAFIDDSSEDEDEDEVIIQSSSSNNRAPINASGFPKRITLSKKKSAVVEEESHLVAEEQEPKPKKGVRFELGKRQGPSQNQRKRKANLVEGWDEAPEPSDDNDRRNINYEIEKNKGLTQKRKKGARHSRVKRRAQYKKALIKRRSQVPDVKRELNKYGGESRGIRMSTVRSIPLSS